MGDRWIRAVAARIVCALALLMLGFSGHGLAMPDDGSVAAQYRLPDGSYPSLCGTNGDAGGLPHDRHHCDLCFAAAGHAFAPPPATFDGFFIVAGTGLFASFPLIGSNRNALRHGLCRGPPRIA
jgi:hypothetical protein